MSSAQKCVQSSSENRVQSPDYSVWGSEIDALTLAFESMTPARRRYALGQLLFLGTSAQRKEAALQVEFGRDER